MIVGGENDDNKYLDDVEVVAISSASSVPIPCFSPSPVPEGTSGMAGTFINGAPLVCGGRNSSDCYG